MTTPIPSTMRAAVIAPTSPTTGRPYTFPGNVAPSSAISVSPSVPTPQLPTSTPSSSSPSSSSPGQQQLLLVRIVASTVYKDNLEWNELYAPSNPATLGNDFSGIVVDVLSSSSSSSASAFAPGDEVYGMTHANKGGTWAEYALVTEEEAVKKPKDLGWEEAAAIPGSAITADQALFRHVGLEIIGGEQEDGDKRRKTVLITGATGGIGTFLVRFAKLAGHKVIAASSGGVKRDGAFLKGELGADEAVDYEEMKSSKQLADSVDVVVDSVGGNVLQDCWALLKGDGTILSFDACSWGYREAHREKGLTKGKEGVRALYMIAEPSRESMARITDHVAKGNIRGRVAKTVKLEDVREAYEAAHTRGGAGYGKTVVLI